MAAQAPRRRRQLGGSRRPALHFHASATWPMAQRAHHQCDRTSTRGVQAQDQDADRAAICRHRRYAVLVATRFRPDQHAQGRWLADARREARRAADRSRCLKSHRAKIEGHLPSTALEKRTSGLPTSSSSRPKMRFERKSTIRYLYVPETALRNSNHIPDGTSYNRSPDKRCGSRRGPRAAYPPPWLPAPPRLLLPRDLSSE